MKKIVSGVLALLFISCMSAYCQHSMNVATYNLRNDNKGDSIQGDGWARRCPIVSQLITYHDFDIFGTQECLHHQLEDLTRAMPGYAYIGVGRDDGKLGGEYSAIFYKKDKFKLLDSGNFWLSKDTSKPNLGWDAACIRICTWGKFQDVNTGFQFLMFNLHMDHVGVEARKESAKLILKKVKEMAGNNHVILTGDFNVDQTNESYTLLNTSGILKDSYEMSPIRYATNGTFNAFKTYVKTDERIDHIFLTKDFAVERYGVLTDCYWTAETDSPEKVDSHGNAPEEVSMKQYKPRIPSDHYPVAIRVNY